MKKNYLLATALAIMTMASCSDNDFIGGQETLNANESGAISFSFDVPAVTRAGGSAAATALGSQFIVWGEKGEAATGAAYTADDVGDNTHQLVFKNYVVEYTANTAFKTTSNTKDWEYVGQTPYTANVIPSTGETTQTIKYWDYSATNYVFTAVSALSEDITTNRVNIEKITDASSTASNKVYNKGYIIKFNTTGEDPSYTYASFDKLYFSDRQVISQGTGTDRTATNAYGGNVTLTFRNVLSQIRVGIYETIPGYAISDIHFFVSGNNEAKVAAVDAFGAICPNIKSSTYTEALKVTYEPSGTVENHPIVTPVTKANTETAVTPTADLILGTNTSTVTTAAPLGTSTTSPTWDTSGGTFTPVFPQAGNTTNLQLKCNYTLYNSVSGETINVTGATAEVPAQYLQWKPNFKYTYLFKISDNTNGSTGGSVVGLYPITFDAVEIVAEDGQAEYITTVSEPSITTFGVVTSNADEFKSYRTGGNEYTAATGIDKLNLFATIVDNHVVIDPTSHYNVYTVTTSNSTTYPITEASVAESLAEISAKTHNVTCTPYTTNVTETATVPGEDGVDITLTAGKAIQLANVAAGTYAIEYEKTARTYKAQEVTYATSADLTTALTNVTLYKENTFTTEATGSDWVNKDTKFYKKVVDNPGVYAVKVINVVAAGGGGGARLAK